MKRALDYTVDLGVAVTAGLVIVGWMAYTLVRRKKA